jgi:hypothetical protein
LLLRATSAFAKPPCPDRQVGVGVDPTLDDDLPLEIAHPFDNSEQQLPDFRQPS